MDGHSSLFPVELHWHPSRLITLTFFKNWDQKLSSGLLLTFMTHSPLPFSAFADTEQNWLITLTFFKSREVPRWSPHATGVVELYVSVDGVFDG